MSNCKNLKKNQKVFCSACGLELLVLAECQSKSKNECCSHEKATDSHFKCCNKNMSIKN